jgi:hypothetical protein
MGSRISNMKSLSHEDNDRDKLFEQFYHACESGDLNTVRQLLPRFSSIRANRIQYNGHEDIVQYLLNYDYFRGPLTKPDSERHEQLLTFLMKDSSILMVVFLSMISMIVLIFNLVSKMYANIHHLIKHNLHS